MEASLGVQRLVQLGLQVLHVLHHLVLLLCGEDVGHLAQVENVVDVLEVAGVPQLVVIEEEDPRGDLQAELLHDALQVVPPVLREGARTYDLSL